MKLNRTLALLILVFSITFIFNNVSAQTESETGKKGTDNSYRKHSIGSSFFLLGNLAPGDSPYYFLLNYGQRLTHEDILFVEGKTWTYYEPLGTYGSSDKKYPGKIRAYGIGAGYQRFLWKNLYITAQATPFFQQFFDEKNKKIQNGFQLYLQSRIGYRFEFFNKRWFIEPSVAFNYWPVNTNFPTTFKNIENGKPNYKLFEPGLHFGYRF